MKDICIKIRKRHGRDIPKTGRKVMGNVAHKMKT